MDSYIEAPYHNTNHDNDHQENEQQHQQNSGLLRFRSAPSSLFFEYTQNSSDSEYSESYERKPDRLDGQYQGGGYSGSGQMTQLPPHYPKQIVAATSTSMERSLDMDISQSTVAPQRNGGGLNLSRQSSSPAGFFNQLNPQNGYTIMRGLGSFRVGNGTNGTSSPRSASRLAIGHLPQIPEIGSEPIKESSPDDVKFRNHEGDGGFESPAGFSFASWGDSGSDASHLSENGGPTSRGTMLTHHLSLPKTSNEMAAIEKLLHFQDSVPCKVRAKRGCATHPRSIAERVRRNRISERMRNLQDLVPNMDKQTNTADMLDLAVDYIKNLQSQFKVLSDSRAKCKCVNLQ